LVPTWKASHALARIFGLAMIPQELELLVAGSLMALG